MAQFCRRCGNRLRAEAAFCTECGTQVLVVGTTSAPVSSSAIVPPVYPAPYRPVREGRSSGAILAVVGVVVVAGIVAGGFLLFRTGYQEADLASLLSPDTSVYLSVNNSPSVWTRLQAWWLLRQAASDSEAVTALERLLGAPLVGSGVASADLGMIGEAGSWLGNAGAVGIVLAPGRTPQATAVARITNPEAATATLLKQFGGSGRSIQPVAYGSAQIYEESPSAAWAVTPRLLIFSTSPAAAQQVIDRERSHSGGLDRSSTFQQAVASVSGNHFAFLYWSSEQSFNALLGSGLTGQLQPVAQWLTAQTGRWSAYALDIDSSTVRVEWYGATVAQPTGPSVDMRPLPGVPAGTVALVEGTDLAALWDTLNTLSPDATAGLDGTLSLLGINVQRDVFGWVSGQWSVAVLPGNWSPAQGSTAALDALLVVQTPDSSLAQSHVAALANALRAGGTTFEPSTYGGRQGYAMAVGPTAGTPGSAYDPGYFFLPQSLVVGATPRSLAAAAGNGPWLRDDSTFKGAFGKLPTQKDALLYLDVAGGLGPFSNALTGGAQTTFAQNVEPVLRHVRALALSSGRSSQGVRGALVATVQ